MVTEVIKPKFNPDLSETRRQRQMALKMAWLEQEQRKEDAQPWVVPLAMAKKLDSTFRDVKCDVEDLDGLKWTPDHLKQASKTFIPPSGVNSQFHAFSSPACQAAAVPTSDSATRVIIVQKASMQSLQDAVSGIFCTDANHDTLSDRTNDTSTTPRHEPLFLLSAPLQNKESLPNENYPSEPCGTGLRRGRARFLTESPTPRIRTRTLSRTTSYRHIDVKNPENSVPKQGNFKKDFQLDTDGQNEVEYVSFADPLVLRHPAPSQLFPFEPIERPKTPTPHDRDDSDISTFFLGEPFHFTPPERSITPLPGHKNLPDFGTGDNVVVNASVILKAEGNAGNLHARSLSTEQDQAALNSSFAQEGKSWRPPSFKRYGATFTPANRLPNGYSKAEDKPGALTGVNHLKTFRNELFPEEDSDVLYEKFFAAVGEQVDRELGIIS
ncbi:hypothetical protein VNI00_004429 [Paramarasmius palmivorus]|uniref:Uncharacterized protein n=1 Tax=Paramarasmius palmivorus TaxID=297713 RepID=A0AAW0DHP8_9AGAR